MAANTTKTSGNMLSSLRSDFLPSIVVFLVALPLCMGIAIASGVPVAAGLITGIVGGLIVGFLAGSPLQVSGPAAGLTVIIYSLVQEHGLEALGVVVLLGGLMQLLAGLAKMGQWFRAVSPAVIQGMLAGIGVLIFASQIHVMVDDAPKGSGLRNLLTIPQAVAKGLPLPTVGTREERVARTALLKDFGTLHDEQTQIGRSTVAIVPHYAPADLEMPREQLASVVDTQTALRARLQETTTRLEQLETADSRVANARQTASDALAATERAIGALQNEGAEKVHDALRQAEVSLAATVSQLKSHDWASKIGIVTILILLAWQWGAFGRLKMVPAPLVAVIVATFAAAVWALPVVYVEVPDRLTSEINLPSMTVFEETSFWVLLQAAAVLAIVASAETLLCATAVDKMSDGAKTNYDRELAAQGVGNMICGVLGALPMTGVIVRSAANVQAGAKSRASAILHGVWLLTFVAALSFLLRSIPVAALAAILVFTGYKLVNIKVLKELRKYGWGEVVTYLATMTMIVVTDLLTGVIVGILISAVRLLYMFSHLDVKLVNDEKQSRAILTMEGTATFLRLPVLAKQLEQVPQNAELHVHFDRLEFIDHACLDLLMSWAKRHENTGGSLVLDWDSLHASFGRTRAAQRRERRTLVGASASENGHSETRVYADQLVQEYEEDNQPALRK
jgi:MFS superfamily sulfate permease-like transporter